jgi:hypothetical protein
MQSIASRSLWLIALLATLVTQAAGAMAQQCLPPPGTHWPPDNGCTPGTVSEMTLPTGTELDRYGSPTGSYFAPTRTPIPARAMACDPVAIHLLHTCYVLEKPATFEACETAAWFGQPGGGTQFHSQQSAANLKQAGSLQQVQCR